MGPLQNNAAMGTRSPLTVRVASRPSTSRVNFESAICAYRGVLVLLFVARSIDYDARTLGSCTSIAVTIVYVVQHFCALHRGAIEANLSRIPFSSILQRLLLTIGKRLSAAAHEWHPSGPDRGCVSIDIHCIVQVHHDLVQTTHIILNVSTVTSRGRLAICTIASPTCFAS